MVFQVINNWADFGHLQREKDERRKFSPIILSRELRRAVDTDTESYLNYLTSGAGSGLSGNRTMLVIVYSIQSLTTEPLTVCYLDFYKYCCFIVGIPCVVFLTILHRTEILGRSVRFRSFFSSFYLTDEATKPDLPVIFQFVPGRARGSTEVPPHNCQPISLATSLYNFIAMLKIKVFQILCLARNGGDFTTSG